MSKELMRLMVLQVAALASVFGTFSPRVMSAVQFVQWLATPDVWNMVWSIFQQKGGLARIQGAYSGRMGAASGQKGHEEWGADPFRYLDELASAPAMGASGPDTSDGPEVMG